MAIAIIPTGDPTPYQGTGTVVPWGGARNTPITPDPVWDIGTTFTPTLPVPNCTEAITILEEAEYELKELLKKNPTVKNIEIALRNVQSSLRALLRIG